MTRQAVLLVKDGVLRLWWLESHAKRPAANAPGLLAMVTAAVIVAVTGVALAVVLRWTRDDAG